METFVAFGQAPRTAPGSAVLTSQAGPQLPETKACSQSSTSRCAAVAMLGAATAVAMRGSKTARAAAKGKKKTLTITEESFDEPDEDVVVTKKSKKKKKQRFDPANEIGVCAPLGFFDPLGFAPKNKRNNFKNLRAMEIKHGRIAMLATVGSVVQHFLHRPDLPEPWTTYVGPVNPVGIGALAIFYGPVGFIQLLGGVFTIFIFEFFLWLERDDRDPGDFGNPFSIPLDTPEMRLKELNNGRMAMMSIVGIWAAELVTKKDAVEQLMFWA
mmetsp:Transcript_74265/g.91214  ORF Transcript_74265/g.91214 Transcript_74265/m.91214 type:complete len:270 (-) Transcript_74265:82-891(-)